jgi:hydroxyacyl-ACP dehydratase HTD2-like protein with hotdog domain
MTVLGLPAVLPEVEFRPSRLQLFRFSAVTWNAHRIHYDEAYASAEGHDGIVVHSTLRGQQLLSVVLRWLGEHGDVLAFSWRNLLPAYADQPVVCRGRVASPSTSADGAIGVTVELEEVQQDGRVGATGTAMVRLRR